MEINNYCGQCGKPLFQPDKVNIKPSWGLTWGLLWRAWLILIPIYILLYGAIYLLAL